MEESFYGHVRVCSWVRFLRSPRTIYTSLHVCSSVDMKAVAGGGCFLSSYFFFGEDEGGHRKYDRVTRSAMILSQMLHWFRNTYFGVCPRRVSFSRQACDSACVGGFLRSPRNAEEMGEESARKEEKAL